MVIAKGPSPPRAIRHACSGRALRRAAPALLALATAAAPVRGEVANPSSRTFDITWTVTLPALAEGAPSAELWIGLPAQTSAQAVSNQRIEAPGRHYVVQDQRYGNSLLKVQGRPADLSEKRVVVACRITRKAVAAAGPWSDPGAVVDMAAWRGPDRLGPIDGAIAQRAQRALARAQVAPRNVRATALALWSALADSFTLEPPPARGIGLGDAPRACARSAGDRTDFHALLVSMCRSVDLPARLVTGYALPQQRQVGVELSPTCWTEVDVTGQGWLPLDAPSQATTAARAPAPGALDADRVECTRGRDIELPGHPRMTPPNMLAEPLLLVDELPVDGWHCTVRVADIPAPEAAAPGR